MSSYDDVKRNMVRNTVSNYVRTIVAMAVGLITFRLIYQSLTQEEFGFWALLWSVFGYGILLDFGFGFAAQKQVAQLSVKKDWQGLSKVLSTTLTFYTGIAVLLGVTVLLGSHQFMRLINVSPENLETYRHVLVVFFIGIGLAFPMGIFPEILRGQQRIRLANYIITAVLLLRVVLTWMAAHFNWGFMPMMLIALGSSLLPDFIAMPLAMRKLPEVRLSPRLFSMACVKETASFSLFAYLTTATNLILMKSDQLVLSATLGIAAVALYQAGAKAAEVFRDFTKQMQDTISPAAAHLHAHGAKDALRDLLVRSTRGAMLIATPLYLLMAFYLPEVLALMTGDRHLPLEIILVGQTLLLWHFTAIPTHSVVQRVYMMTGEERKLSRYGLIEAVLNLCLSVILVLATRSVFCVAVGSLIPTLYIGWVHFWPWLAREAKMTRWELLQKTVLPPCLACLPALGLVLLLKAIPALQFESAWLTILLHWPLVGGASLMLIFRFALTNEERQTILRRVLPRRAQPLATPTHA
jgi:O-antigen/teichoic acid export membrane protein